MHLRPVTVIPTHPQPPPIKRKKLLVHKRLDKKKRKERGHTEAETEKELYPVYYSLAASEFKCARLRWNRAGVIIIASCLLDRTLK